MKMPMSCFLISSGFGSSYMRRDVSSSRPSMNALSDCVPASDWNKSWHAIAPSQSARIYFVNIACSTSYA